MTVDEAERQIGAILAALERDCGSIARSIEIITIDGTAVDDTRRQLIRRVQIEMEPTPGSWWST
jgi:hypothetical protein